MTTGHLDSLGRVRLHDSRDVWAVNDNGNILVSGLDVARPIAIDVGAPPSGLDALRAWAMRAREAWLDAVLSNTLAAIKALPVPQRKAQPDSSGSSCDA